MTQVQVQCFVATKSSQQRSNRGRGRQAATHCISTPACSAPRTDQLLNAHLQCVLVLSNRCDNPHVTPQNTPKTVQFSQARAWVVVQWTRGETWDTPGGMQWSVLQLIARIDVLRQQFLTGLSPFGCRVMVSSSESDIVPCNLANCKPFFYVTAVYQVSYKRVASRYGCASAAVCAVQPQQAAAQGVEHRVASVDDYRYIVFEAYPLCCSVSR